MAGHKMTTKGGMMKKPGGMNKGGTMKKMPPGGMNKGGTIKKPGGMNKGGTIKKPGDMKKGGTVKAKQTKFKKPSNKKSGLFGR